MCLAIPAKIESFVDDNKRFAKADILGIKREICLDLLRDEVIDTGDWVLIHVGFAMSKISDSEAQQQINVLSQLGELAKVQEEARSSLSNISTGENES